MSRLLPRYTQVTGPLLPSKVERSINDASSEVVVHAKGAKKAGHRSGEGDEERMRMIPIIAPSVGGTIPGTDPLAAYIAKETRQSRRAA